MENNIKDSASYKRCIKWSKEDLAFCKVKYQRLAGELIITTLSWIQSSIASWQNKTFGDSKDRPLSIFIHLKKEIQELGSEIRHRRNSIFIDGKLESELADCFILLVGLAEAFGINLEKAVLSKMEVNKRRKWQKPDNEGVIEHERN